jgi:hypothetical protein
VFVINGVPQQMGLFVERDRAGNNTEKIFEKKVLTAEGRLSILPILLQRETREAQQEDLVFEN